MKTTIYLIRHAEYDKEDNTKLTNIGISQAEKLGEILSNKGVNHIVSSPLQRTIESAQPLSDVLNLNIEVDEAFTEYFSDSDESFEEALERTKNGLTKIVEKYPGESIAIFTHGLMVGKLLIWMMYGTSEDSPVRFVEPGAYAEIIHEDGKYFVRETYRIAKV